MESSRVKPPVRLLIPTKELNQLWFVPSSSPLKRVQAKPDGMLVLFAQRQNSLEGGRETDERQPWRNKNGEREDVKSASQRVLLPQTGVNLLLYKYILMHSGKRWTVGRDKPSILGVGGQGPGRARGGNKRPRDRYKGKEFGENFNGRCRSSGSWS